MLLVAAAGALALTLGPRTAWAQCNSSATPAPAASPPTSSFANQSFGPNPPLTPFVLNSTGIGGCNGAEGPDAGSGGASNGGPGIVGQPGGQIIGTNTNLTIFSAPSPFTNSLSIGALVQASGGLGGYGGFSGADGDGGPGATGGNGGTVNLGFNATVTSDPNNPSSNIGLYGNADGGAGGAGGSTDRAGIYARDGGAGGTGGNGGAVTLNASGSITTAVGVQAVAQGGNGGNGGIAQVNPGLLIDVKGGKGGDGGTGGTATAQWSAGTISATQEGVQAVADGGTGGVGGNTDPSIETQGGAGGAGGAGGTASAQVLPGGQVTVTAAPGTAGVTSVFASANGGAGGGGGLAGQAFGTGGGTGGTGGSGGAASATVLGTVTFTGAANPTGLSGEGVLVQANGGSGGSGGDTSAVFGQSGSGGPAGAGGSATLTLGNTTDTGTIRSTGTLALGALVQSVGGGGGNAGNVNFLGSGGAGAAGGNGGPVTVTSDHASVITSGVSGRALVAQSIGGGGGSGGNTNILAAGAALAIGGNGGLGGNGGTVQINLGQNGVFGSTDPLGGSGILAQSIGGSGGDAGSAASTGIGFISLVIGGDAGGGGAGGLVTITNGALVTTYGDHAAGIEAQSIGGGGGKAGAATSFIAGVLPTVSVAVGGRGGGGGPAGDVSLTNTGQITTYGPNADGILMQSVGGGGGSGGESAARAAAFSPDEEVPAISVSVAVGGAGGAGNTGGKVTLNNSGLVTTAGDGAVAVMAQSVGGGGGNAGDATAASYANGSQAGVSISVAAAVGGKGGSGGTGGNVNLTNSGLMVTLGADAYGVFAQSVGGGGGMGGTGDATAASNDAKDSFAASLAVGGTGGTGGDAGIVGLNNLGSIVTSGDRANGVFAQSVGGGGGTAGGGTATAAGGNLSIAVGVGGSGGAAGNGNTVTLQNSGNIITRGTDAIGLYAQSVGGGGGDAGKGGATAGGVNETSNAQALYDTLAAGLNFNQTVTKVTDNILQVGQIGQNVQSSLDELESILPQPQAPPAGESEEGTATKINVGVSVGGTGGAAGAGGAVNTTNTGYIGTYGAESDAIYAQSVGGGGGAGGAASSTGSASDDSQIQSTVAVGGSGGAAGAGGAVTVVNGTNGTIFTQGVEAFGIMAQSVGGGGGDAAVAGTVDGSLKSLGVSVGGTGNAGGDGGAVSVTTGDGTSGSSISTTGKNGIAILAQSVGGGGGLVRSITTDQTFDPSKLIDNPQGRIADIQGLSLNFGGQSGASGSGGPVTVTVSGPVSTQGLDAHAIVAQSIGGGGGIVVGGQMNVPPGGFAGPGGGAGGNGGVVSVSLNPGAQITTVGDGAYGILAQSIGGGGGTAGDLSTVNGYGSASNTIFEASVATAGSKGNGGGVGVKVSGATITTHGANAPAIFAQSLGGGGGLFDFRTGSFGGNLVFSSASLSGSGGDVNVAVVQGSSVSALGSGSAGIIAESDGGSASPITISIDTASKVVGGLPASNLSAASPTNSAIEVWGGSTNPSAPNTITNAGTIQALGDPTVSYAIQTHPSPVISNSNGAPNNVITNIVNTGTIIGNISNPNPASVLDNRPGAVLDAPVTINLGGGQLLNEGTLQVGGTAVVGRTTLTGNLVQSSTGTLVIDIAPNVSTADRLQVNGSALLGGRIVPVFNGPARPGANTASGIIVATGGLTLGGSQLGASAPVAESSSPVVQYSVTPSNPNSLDLGYTVDYGGSQALRAQGLDSSNRREVGRALNAILADDPEALGQFAASLLTLPTAQALAQTLDAVSGEAVADVQQTVFEAQQAFSTTVLRQILSEIPGGGGGTASYATAGLTPVAGPHVDAKGMRVWVAGFGGADQLSGTDQQGTLHTQIAGGLMGIDKWFDADRMAGFSVGGGTTNFEVADRASQGTVTSFNIGAYGLARFGQAYVTGLLDYGNFSGDVQRSALGSFAGGRASVNSNLVGGRAEAGWEAAVGRIRLTPFAALEVDHLWEAPLNGTPSKSPGTSNLGLHVDGQEQTSIPLTLGGRVGSTFQVGRGHVLNMSVELGWVHEFNPQRQVTAAFLAAPDLPFRVLGVSASENSALTALDAKLSLTHNLAVFANFTGRFSGVESAVGGYGGVQVTW